MYAFNDVAMSNHKVYGAMSHEYPFMVLKKYTKLNNITNVKAAMTTKPSEVM